MSNNYKKAYGREEFDEGFGEFKPVGTDPARPNESNLFKAAAVLPFAVGATVADGVLNAPRNIYNYQKGFPYEDKRVQLNSEKDLVIPATWTERSFLREPNQVPVDKWGNRKYNHRTEPYVQPREHVPYPKSKEAIFERFRADERRDEEDRLIRSADSWPWETGKDMAGVSMSDPYKPKPKINTERWNRPFPTINTERWNNPPEPRTTVARSPRYGKDPKLGISNRLQPNKQRSLDNL